MYSFIFTIFVILFGFLFIILINKFDKVIEHINSQSMFYLYILSIFAGFVRSLEDLKILPQSFLLKSPYLWAILGGIYILYLYTIKRKEIIYLLEIIILLFFIVNINYLDWNYLFNLFNNVLLFSPILLSFYLILEKKYFYLFLPSFLDFLFSYTSQKINIAIESHYYQRFLILCYNNPYILLIFKLFSLFLIIEILNKIEDNNLREFMYRIIFILYSLAGFRVFVSSLFHSILQII